MTMQIFAPTAIFEPKEVPGLDTQWFPLNQLGKQLCHFADVAYLPEEKLRDIEDMGIHVERVNAPQVMPSAKDFDAIAGFSRNLAAYCRHKQVKPKHIMDEA